MLFYTFQVSNDCYRNVLYNIDIHGLSNSVEIYRSFISDSNNTEVYTAQAMLNDTEMLDENQVIVTIIASYHIHTYNTSVLIG